MAYTGFYELNCPTEDGKHGWYVDSKQLGIGHLLNHTRHIANIANVGGKYPSRDFYFDLESSAHAQAAGYYKNYGKTYPYKAEWMESITRESGGSLVADVSSESQVMVFV